MKRGLVILDHGSRRPEAAEHLAAIADAVRARATGLRVDVAHLELAAPDLLEVVGRCAREGVERVQVLPFFLSPGRHLTRDVPELLQALRTAHPTLRLELLPALGESPALPDLILAALDSPREPG